MNGKKEKKICRPHSFRLRIYFHFHLTLNLVVAPVFFFFLEGISCLDNSSSNWSKRILLQFAYVMNVIPSRLPPTHTQKKNNNNNSVSAIKRQFPFSNCCTAIPVPPGGGRREASCPANDPPPFLLSRLIAVQEAEGEQ